MEEKNGRFVCFDRDIGVELYRLSGLVEKFPNHFHEHYVVGVIAAGERLMSCKGREYRVRTGDLVLFNPRDNHMCAPTGGEPLDFRAMNIRPEVMSGVAAEVAGQAYTPRFMQNVVPDSDMSRAVLDLYAAVERQAPGFEKEEAFFFLMEQLLREYAAPFQEEDVSRTDPRIRRLCAYMEEHFSENITLDRLLELTDCGKSYLLRSFTKQTGVSPYRYLQTVRLDRAKRFLEQGVPPVEAADLAGFADQSHFTHFFREFTGLTPRQYQRIFITEERYGHTE